MSKAVVLVVTDNDTDECDHPADAVKWNPYNAVTQCHRCGQVFDSVAMPSDDAMRWTSAPLGPEPTTS